jgi:hypothetical protein
MSIFTSKLRGNGKDARLDFYTEQGTENFHFFFMPLAFVFWQGEGW